MRFHGQPDHFTFLNHFKIIDSHIDAILLFSAVQIWGVCVYICSMWFVVMAHVQVCTYIVHYNPAFMEIWHDSLSFARKLLMIKYQLVECCTNVPDRLL